MSAYPEDTKGPTDLPVYRINESQEELVVGQRRACFWSRCCAKKANVDGEQPKRSCAKRAVRWFFTIVLLLGVVGFVGGWRKANHFMSSHPVVCVPLDGNTYSIDLALASAYTKIGLDESLTGGDISITHSADVNNGTAAISFELPKDLKFVDGDDTPELYACHIAGPRFAGLGVFTKDKHTRAPKAAKATITLSADEVGHSRGTFLRGEERAHHGCGMRQRIMRKAIQNAIQTSIDEREESASWVNVELADAE